MNLDNCLICGKELPPHIKEYAHKTFEEKTCSTECSRKELVKRHGCCEQATPITCHCTYSFSCPIHGETHIGSHE